MYNSIYIYIQLNYYELYTYSMIPYISYLFMGSIGEPAAFPVSHMFP